MKTHNSIFSVLKSYKGHIALLVFATLLMNGISLIIPKILASGIDYYTKVHILPYYLLAGFVTATILIFIFTFLQNILQVLTSETVAKDLRTKLTDKISRQTYSYIETIGPSTLLTNLTSDVDAVKMFVAQAFANLVSAVILIIGATILLFLTNWKLALAVIPVIPIIAFTFSRILSKVRPLFKITQQIIDKLNQVINESITGSALIRILNSQPSEYLKFADINAQARDNGLKILNFFATLVPIVSFIASLATVIILSLGGHFVISGNMTLGSLFAFSSYMSVLIFPVIMIGFLSNIIARTGASYDRISIILNASDPEATGNLNASISGNIELKDINLKYGNRETLKNISLTIPTGTRTALIGPTAAGKTQLLYLLSGLTNPTSGTICYDGRNIDDYDPVSLHRQVGFVFQDSIVFNLTIKENIAFNQSVSSADLKKAIKTAELEDYINSLPKKLNTVIAQRGASLSGGQKQRLMLARALALNPKVLLLDDFTARVDLNTERKIYDNLKNNYPGLTILSVTQKIDSVKDYDQIIMLMEGEIVASGTHEHLLKTSPEYAQMYQSQRSTNHYELSAK